MSDDFRRKLQDYEEGKLSEEERVEIEKELEKMEAYQAHLDELLGKERAGTDNQAETRLEGEIIRRGKWKARLNTVLSVLVIFILVSWASNIFSSIYYGEGNPSRREIYSDVASFAIAVTHPNVSVFLNSNTNGFFNFELTGDMKKQVGDERYKIGDYSLSFRFGKPNIQQMTWSNDYQNNNYFKLPEETYEDMEQDWSTLEKLPEGTVAEAYVSLDRFFSTDEILKQLEGKNMDPVWFAVDAGLEENDLIGFPYNPMWHHDDLTITSYKEEKSGWFGKTVMQGGAYPPVEEYGSGDLRNENFIKTLRLMQDHSSITRRIAPFLNIEQVTQYVESNGVNIYGVVITGPTKELLKLKKEPWVRDIHMGEAHLWNWQDR
ncbi:Sigma factor regulator N-terminal [Paenibacillus uliginis N3/975]|uniref:Sigma factor regulator N-terminal n=1 Tax=Paenibacillus uliginis N3/975 TaxID=1313296 RepID=A0A1X7G661_9BACL|nr:anti-sigma factor [Paenibacillus uliginis]SMF64684.1 Sigma factor regulator N-terminal [Paenibacillus uliginis N3/975]